MERPDIEAALERANKATDGKWTAIRQYDAATQAEWRDVWGPDGEALIGHEVAGQSHRFIRNADNNSVFIAGARADVPALAEYALHMEALNLALRVELEDLRRSKDAWQRCAFEHAAQLLECGGSVTIGVQVYGKTMFAIAIPVNATEAEVIDIVKRDGRVLQHFPGGDGGIRWLYTHHKLLNCVVDLSGVP